MACLKEKQTVQAKIIEFCVGGPSQKIVLPIMLFRPAYAYIIIPPTHSKPTPFERELNYLSNSVGFGCVGGIIMHA